MKKVLLIGIGGVYNYGCEAILRGSVEILKRIDQNIEISYASYNFTYDKERLKDLDIRLIKRFNKVKRWTVRRVFNKIFSIVGIKTFDTFDSVGFIKEFDTIFSIGGDIYTLNSSNEANLRLPKFIDKCLAKYPNLKYALWGASVGPFEKNKDVLDYYKAHLSSANLIVAREENTIQYLKSIGVTDNVCFLPDPAFFVPFKLEKPEYHETKRIGINLSPLSALFFYNTVEEAVERQAEAIENLVNRTNAEIILIPHVFSHSILDDDYRYLNKIFSKVSEPAKSKLKLIHEDNGFVGRKHVLSSLDFMMAARMHCGINAVTCGIPTLFLSYSAKTKGMCNFIYGNNIYLRPITSLEETDKLIQLIKLNNKPLPLEELRKGDFNKLLSL